MIIRNEAVDRWLAAGSSPVDWCEDNYTVSGNIAEFTNTISNVLFVFIPLLCLGTRVWNNYTKLVSCGVLIQLVCLLLVGFASAYFHGTLSLLGQLLDEITILWGLAIGYATLTPDRYRPKFYRGISALIISSTVAAVLTMAWFVAPHLNAFGLLCGTVPIIVIEIRELTVYRNPATARITAITLATLLAALSCWFADRALCGMWRRLGIPGLHSVWHLLAALATYLTVTVFSYIKAESDSPALKPTIRYLPHRVWGIPYVHCRHRP